MITSFFKPKRDRATAAPGKENSTFKKQKTTTPSNTKEKTLPPPPATALELMSHLSVVSDANDSSIGDPSWRDALNKHFSSPSFKRLASFVDSERQRQTIYPPPEDTFAALNLCPLSETKLVIVGQDPYHGPHQAHGLCFSVRHGIQTPPSLKNIYKELKNDPKIDNFNSIPSHGNLERWAKQGVLLINNVLTVRKGQAHSHKKKGWEELTDAIIKAVDRRQFSDGTKKGVVFLLWGKPATEKTKTALIGSSSSRHRIFCSSHPSPLGATKTKSPFLGSQCFSRANEALLELGYDAIDWRVDGPLP